MRSATDRPHPRNLPGNGETHHKRSRVLMREAAQLAEELGWNFSPPRLRLVVGAYLSQQGCRPSDDAATFRGWFLSYADPTGEQAVRRVMAP